MPIDFQEHRITFDSNSGGPRNATHRFEFPSRVTKARSFLNGFHIGFTDSQHPLRSVEINTRINEIDEEDVEVFAVFALRDNSGNFDDRYGGFIDVVVVVDRV